MPTAETQGRTPLASAARRPAAWRWRHPLDSATGTIALGVLLTLVLVAVLRLLGA